MNDITIFTYENTNVRTITTEDGEPLFVASDIAKVLGYRDAYNMTRRLDPDEKGTRSASTLGGTQEITVITEGGLYNAILGSQIEGARKFRRWVTSEVLPSIRKHGMYATAPTIDDMIADPDMAIRLLTTLKEERAARAKAEAEVEAQRPVAALGKAIETAEGDLTPSAFGKILSNTITTMGPNKFCRWLLDNNFAFRNGQGKIIPMQDAVNRGILTPPNRRLS